MNNALFQQAREAYSAADYVNALEGFTKCLQGVSEGDSLAAGELGLLYHQIGNCLMKLHNYDEAIHAYTQAVGDTAYSAIGAVNCNLGNSYAALHDFDNAVNHFNLAVSDKTYNSAYKAYSGLGKAYLKLGKSAEAGAAFRSAAVDANNPNPAQALLNLGICFMALERPADAIESYKSCLEFDMAPAMRNKLYANLGQAYTSTGQMQKAVDAFEAALADKTYFLNDAASVDYRRAIGLVAQGTAVMQPVSDANPLQQQGDLSGLDVVADGAPVYHETDLEAAAKNPYYYSYDVSDAYSSGDERFFNATEEEIEQWSKGVAKQDRKRRNVGLKIVVVLILLVLLAAAGGFFAYTQGFGYPTQQTIVQQLFADHDSAKSLFTSDLEEKTVTALLDAVVTDTNVQIDGVERSMNQSIAYVTAHVPEAGQVQYRVSLARDGIGWKITNVELYFPSQN